MMLAICTIATVSTVLLTLFHCSQSLLVPNKLLHFSKTFTLYAAYQYPTQTSQDKLILSDLPLDFDDAVKRSVQSTLRALQDNAQQRCRVDFDTTAGDVTYTSLKNTLPFIKAYLLQLCQEFAILPDDFLQSSLNQKNRDDSDQSDDNQEEIDNPADTLLSSLANAQGLSIAEEESSHANDSENSKGQNPPSSMSLRKQQQEVANKIASLPAPSKTIRVFFPDMGAAILARNEWKQYTEQPLMPRCVVTANIKNDNLQDSDMLAIILCPQSSEEDSVSQILAATRERNIPTIIVNPKIINMDQGFGVRARRVQKEVLDSFTTAYQLKTLRLGAVTRQYPQSFTLWIEDETITDGGYAWYGNYDREPAFADIEELFETIEETRLGTNAKKGNGIPGATVVKEMLSFFQGLQKL